MGVRIMDGGNGQIDPPVPWRRGIDWEWCGPWRIHAWAATSDPAVPADTITMWGRRFRDLRPPLYPMPLTVCVHVAPRHVAAASAYH